MRERIVTMAAAIALGLASVGRAQQVATPALSPAASMALPATVTVSCATADASIRYTTNGLMPTTSSALYSAPLAFTNDTALRARAFKSGLTDSEPAYGWYARAAQPALNYSRTVSNPAARRADAALSITRDTNAVCHIVEERWGGALTPTNIASGGVWPTNSRVIRWGPFFNVASQQLSYALSGGAGRYLVSGVSVADGRWTYPLASTNFDLWEGDGQIPAPPVQAARPVFTPVSGANVPVLVTITSATAGAQIRYTLDGSVPVVGSTLYTGAVSFVSETLIRAAAFRTNYQPSEASWAFYPARTTNPTALVIRALNTNTPSLPVVALTITQAVAGTCLAYEERIPTGLTPTNISADGLYNPTNRIIKWGAYAGSAVRAVSYAVSATAPGVFLASGRWSLDGRGAETTGSVVTVAAPPGGGIPSAPPKAPRPALNPAGSTTLPVSVTITSALAGATIRYTRDGSVPGPASPVYGAALNVTSTTVLRARTFAAGYETSDGAAGFYEQAAAAHALVLVRTLVNNNTYLPTIQIAATPSANVKCYSVEETLDEGLAPYDIGTGGTWNPTNRTIRWGPFVDASARTLTYNASGPSGIYDLNGRGSVDGQGVAVAGTNVVTVDLNTMSRVATPSISPRPNGLFPVMVTVTTATAGATIRYTLDGAMPNENSAVYSGPFQLDTITRVKARAFKTWMFPSGTADLLYGEEALGESNGIVRTIYNNGTGHPRVELAVTAASDIRSQAVVEDLPPGATATAISGSGVFLVGSRTVKWGPFLDDQDRVLSYQISGPDGSCDMPGRGSFNGFPVPIAGDQVLTINNQAESSVAVSNDWSFSTSMRLAVTPSDGVNCFAAELYLPAGVAPTNINLDGLWNAATRTIKWGPYLDHTPRSFTLGLIGAQGVMPVRYLVSVNGANQLIEGNQSVNLGLPPPTNVMAVAGNRALYLAWDGSEHAAGVDVYYWTRANRSDIVMTNVGAAPGTYALTNLINGTNYSVMLRGYDRFGVESADSSVVSGIPSGAGGMLGTIAFDQGYYANTGAVASLTVVDADLNANASVVESVSVQVFSTTDPDGIAIHLAETSANSGVFTTMAFGTSLRFSFASSDDATDVLRVTEGDAVSARYLDALPSGTRTNSALFAQYDADADGLPDGWERTHFDGYGVAEAGTDWDQDGSLDHEEWKARTNPKDPDDFLAMSEVVIASDGLDISWRSEPGVFYDLQKAHGLTNAFFLLLEDIADTAPVNTYRDILEDKPAFYRIIVK